MIAVFAAIVAQLCLAQAVAKDFGFPIVTSYGAEQMGGDPATYCVRQGPDGVLYFGGNGLITYDGDRWTATSVPGVRMITDIAFGKDGRLWVAAEGDAGWFERLPNSQWQFHSLSRYLLPGAIRGQVARIFARDDGVMFVAAGHIYRWDGKHMQTWEVPELDGPHCFEVNGEIWVQSFGSRMYRIGAAGPELLRDFDVGTTEKAMVLWVSPDGKRWLYGTKTSLYLNQNGKIEPFDPVTTQLVMGAGTTLNSVRALPDGRFLFCTSGRGILFSGPNGEREQLLQPGDGVPPHVRSVFVDREGLLWAISSTGVVRINLDAATRVFDERARIPSRPYPTVAIANGAFAAANVQGALVLTPDNQHFTPLSFDSSVVEDLASSPDGLLISARRGLWLQTPQQMRLVTSFAGDVRCAIPSRTHPGEILVSEYGLSIQSVVAGQEARTIVRDLPVVASSLAEDDQGNLWIGTATRGVLLAHRDLTDPVTAQAPAASLKLPSFSGATYVRSTLKGDVFVIADSGAWVKRAGEQTFAAVRDFPSRPIAAVSPCLDDGTLWIAHAASGSYAACVARISPSGHAWRWAPHSIADLDTIGPPRSLCGEKTEDGRIVLWIGGSKAVLRHVVGRELSAPRPAAPLLKAFFRNRDDQREPMAATTPYSTRVIDFEFAEPQFARRALLHLETRIDGIDTDWVPATRDSRRELTALRDGHYRFQVRAVAETGVLSEPTVFSFTVLPPWWRTPGAIVVYLVALISLVYAAHLLRIRTLRQRNLLLEEKVRERTEELAEASAAKTLFVANMSHDIRNPLNGIVGLALALEDSRLDHQQREIVATLRECTTYLSSLVDDVLDFASIEAGRVELRPGPFVPAELLNSVVTTLKAEAAERGALITIETDPEVPSMLLGDAGRIQQILVNYVSNAMKYSGGHIRLAASIPSGSAGEVEFSVSDEGPGISEADQATLFTKFSRLEGARRSHIPGTGLGLASCRLLADIMGGAVGVESQLGHGARFYLRLPLTIATEPAPAEVDLTLPQASVLLVEDTDYNAMAATAVLRKLGLTCDRARNGEEAVRLFTEKRHNIVLLDRNLPDMDGAEVARRLRELETDGMRAVLLAVTAYCGADDRALCLKAGMDAFVGKPLTPEKLRRVLIAAGRQMLASATMDAQPEAKAAAPIDTSLLEYLSDGTDGGLAAQAERFIAALDETHRGLLSARDRKFAAKDLGDAAHRVLGQARMIGATALCEAATAAETAARQGDNAGFEASLPRINAEVANLTAALRHSRREQRA